MTGLAQLVADGVLTERAPLAALTTYKFGGPARWLLEADSEDDLIRLAAALAEEPARRAAEADRGGLEFYVGIPGSVGGAVCMNAGCHGSDTAEWLVTARIADVRTGRVREAGPSDLGMSYRHSEVGGDEVVTAAVFRTVPRARADAEERMRAITAWRREHQPGGTLNAGSVFKNPPNDSAGRLIDSLGLKGFRVGAVSVSARHANFFVAGEGATAQDVHDLVAEVRRRVYEESGVLLEPEVRFVGRFSGDAR